MLKYQKDTVRRNLTLTRECADRLRLISERSGTTQSMLVDRALHSMPVELMNGFCADFNPISGYLAALSGHEASHTALFAESLVYVLMFLMGPVSAKMSDNALYSDFGEMTMYVDDSFEGHFGTCFIKGPAMDLFQARFKELRSRREAEHAEGFKPFWWREVIGDYVVLWKEFWQKMPNYGGDMCNFMADVLRRYCVVPEPWFGSVWNMLEEREMFDQTLFFHEIK